VCQYAKTYEKLFVHLSYASTKATQDTIRNALYGPKNQAKVGKDGIRLAFILD
jgi:hypothetical protein